MAMKRSARAFGMVVGVALLSAACGPASESEIGVDDPGLEVMTDTPGSTGPNGLENQVWHDYKVQTFLALQRPLLVNGAIDPLTVTGLDLDAPLSPSHELFDHIIGCAVADGAVVYHGTRAYEGQGMVKGASLWTGQALSQSVIHNVLECVIAFVNDKTDNVQVLVSGRNVNDDGEDHSAFIHSEAVWCADAPTPSTINVEVYPTASFADGCGIDAEAALRQRYCYQPETCGLIYKEILDFSTDCQAWGAPENGQYICNGRRCTMTWLADNTPDWCKERPRPRQ